MRQIDKRDFMKLASKAGFKTIRCRGDHMILRHEDGRQFCITARNPKSVVMLRLIKEFRLETA